MSPSVENTAEDGRFIGYGYPIVSGHIDVAGQSDIPIQVRRLIPIDISQFFCGPDPHPTVRFGRN